MDVFKRVISTILFMSAISVFAGTCCVVREFCKFIDDVCGGIFDKNEDAKEDKK